MLRGTADIADATNDILADNVDFLGGKAHSGLARGARAIFEGCQDLLRKEANPEYKIVVTGHSLGAGTAHLLAALIMDSGIEAKYSAMDVYAYAPPPPFADGPDVKFPSRPNVNLYSFVNDDDIIPRTSFRNVVNYIYKLRDLDQKPWTLMERLKIIVSDSPVDPTNDSSLLENPLALGH